MIVILRVESNRCTAIDWRLSAAGSLTTAITERFTKVPLIIRLSIKLTAVIHRAVKTTTKNSRWHPRASVYTETNYTQLLRSELCRMTLISTEHKNPVLCSQKWLEHFVLQSCIAETDCKKWCFSSLFVVQRILKSTYIWRRQDIFEILLSLVAWTN